MINYRLTNWLFIVYELTNCIFTPTTKAIELANDQFDCFYDASLSIPHLPDSLSVCWILSCNLMKDRAPASLTKEVHLECWAMQ